VKKKKFDLIKEVRIEEMVAEGKCLVRHENLVVFVTGVAPSDVVDLQITRQQKKFLEAKPVHFYQFPKCA